MLDLFSSRSKAPAATTAATVGAASAQVPASMSAAAVTASQQGWAAALLSFAVLFHPTFVEKFSGFIDLYHVETEDKARKRGRRSLRRGTRDDPVEEEEVTRKISGFGRGILCMIYALATPILTNFFAGYGLIFSVAWNVSLPMFVVAFVLTTDQSLETLQENWTITKSSLVEEGAPTPYGAFVIGAIVQGVLYLVLPMFAQPGAIPVA